MSQLVLRYEWAPFQGMGNGLRCPQPIKRELGSDPWIQSGRDGCPKASSAVMQPIPVKFVVLDRVPQETDSETEISTGKCSKNNAWERIKGMGLDRWKHWSCVVITREISASPIWSWNGYLEYSWVRQRGWIFVALNPSIIEYVSHLPTARLYNLGQGSSYLLRKTSEKG